MDKHTRNFLISKTYDDIHQIHKTIEVVRRNGDTPELRDLHEALENVEHKAGVAKEEREM